MCIRDRVKTMDNEKDTTRYKDEGFRISYFKKEIFVHCPECDKRALVSNDAKSNVKLICPNCHFRQNGFKTIYYLEVKFYCSNCAERIERCIKSNDKKESVKVQCPKCEITHSYQPRVIPMNVSNFDSKGEEADPYYNLPLWLKGQIKNNTLWAYNYEHLEYLKKYVEAKLRTRSGYYFMSVAEKLPTWIKSSKNRNDIIKLINKLEKK